MNEAEMPVLAMELSIESALATIRDFATANALSGDALLDVVGRGALAYERSNGTLPRRVMTVRHVMPAEEAQAQGAA